MGRFIGIPTLAHPDVPGPQDIAGGVLIGDEGVAVLQLGRSLETDDAVGGDI